MAQNDCYKRHAKFTLITKVVPPPYPSPPPWHIFFWEEHLFPQNKSTKQSYIQFQIHYIQKKRIKGKKETRNIKIRMKKEMGGGGGGGVAIMPFIQSIDMIRSSCSAYILFMQSTRWITYNYNFGMITNNIIYNIIFLYTYNYIHTIIKYNKTNIIILCSNNKK